jgi:hypothetical protein
VDVNLCTRSVEFYDALLAHGVKTAIELIPARYASSCTALAARVTQCSASAGSPCLGKTAILPPYKCNGDYQYPGACIDHTLGLLRWCSLWRSS